MNLADDLRARLHAAAPDDDEQVERVACVVEGIRNHQAARLAERGGTGPRLTLSSRSASPATTTQGDDDERTRPR
jgi:hypothetical protein